MTTRIDDLAQNGKRAWTAPELAELDMDIEEVHGLAGPNAETIAGTTNVS